jgi:hypothetical protein
MRLTKSRLAENIEERIRKDFASKVYEEKIAREDRQRSECRGMVFGLCEDAEKRVLSAKQWSDKHARAVEMEMELTSMLFKRIEPLLTTADSGESQIAFQNLTDEIAKRREAKLKQRNEFVAQISELSNGIETQVAAIERSPYLDPNIEETEQGAVPELVNLVSGLTELGSQLLDVERKLIDMDGRQYAQNSRIIDELNSLQPRTQPTLLRNGQVSN